MVIYGGYGGQAGARIFSQEMYMLKIESAAVLHWSYLRQGRGSWR